MKLELKGLEAAYSAGRDYVMEMDDRTKQMLRVSITAYLSTVTPAEVGGLVERLQSWDHCWPAPGLENAVAEAATALEAQAAELAAKEEARAEQWRLRREAEASRDTAFASFSTERAAHAETKRERDAAKTKSNYWQAEYLNACRDASSFADDLVSADAIIEEMVAAENEWQCNPADDERIASAQSRASVYLAARRVREGGKVE